jgi:hypothetical protein
MEVKTLLGYFHWDSGNNFYLGLIHKDQDILKKMAYIEVDNSLGKIINEKEGEDNG